MEDKENKQFKEINWGKTDKIWWQVAAGPPVVRLKAKTNENLRGCSVSATITRGNEQKGWKDK